MDIVLYIVLGLTAGICGELLGAKFVVNIDAALLKKIFGVFLLLIALKMIFIRANASKFLSLILAC